MRGVLRRFRRRFGIAAPRLTVRTHVPWYWRALRTIVVLTVSIASALWMYEAGMRFVTHGGSGADEASAPLREKVAALEEELERLKQSNGVGDSALQIERTAQARLAKQLKTLEAENARLKEDLAFFEKLSSRDQDDDKLSVYRFKVERDGMPGEYRYWLLLTQGGSKERVFQGRLQLVVDLRQGDKDVTLVLPEDNASASPAYRISFKRFLRSEGTFRIDPEAQVRSIQLRVFEQGASQPRATQRYNLS